MDSIAAFVAWVDTTRLSIFIQESAWAFPMIESIHVLALAFVVGTITIVDLRLLGLASGGRPIEELCREVLPWTWRAFLVAALAGSLMFVSHAKDYFENTAFRLKILVLLVAGANMLIFHLVTYRSVGTWGREAVPPVSVKIAGAFSLTCWVGVVFFGRLIGFTMPPPL